MAEQHGGRAEITGDQKPLYQPHAAYLETPFLKREINGCGVSLPLHILSRHTRSCRCIRSHVTPASAHTRGHTHSPTQPRLKLQIKAELRGHPVWVKVVVKPTPPSSMTCVNAMPQKLRDPDEPLHLPPHAPDGFPCLLRGRVGELLGGPASVKTDERYTGKHTRLRAKTPLEPQATSRLMYQGWSRSGCSGPVPGRNCRKSEGGTAGLPPLAAARAAPLLPPAQRTAARSVSSWIPASMSRDCHAT